MANSNWDNIPKTVQQKILANFAKEFHSQNVLAHLTHVELVPKTVGKWEALWLKLTFRKPPMVYRMPVSTSDTITFKRPHAYEPTVVASVSKSGTD